MMQAENMYSENIWPKWILSGWKGNQSKVALIHLCHEALLPLIYGLWGINLKAYDKEWLYCLSHYAATTETVQYRPNQNRSPNISERNHSIEGQQSLKDKKRLHLENKTQWTQRIVAPGTTASSNIFADHWLIIPWTYTHIAFNFYTTSPADRLMEVILDSFMLLLEVAVINRACMILIPEYAKMLKCMIKQFSSVQEGIKIF